MSHFSRSGALGFVYATLCGHGLDEFHSIEKWSVLIQLIQHLRSLSIRDREVENHGSELVLRIAKRPRRGCIVIQCQKTLICLVPE